MLQRSESTDCNIDVHSQLKHTHKEMHYVGWLLRCSSLLDEVETVDGTVNSHDPFMSGCYSLLWVLFSVANSSGANMSIWASWSI